MALGQNKQFFYSPDVRIFINSITNGGIIEVSDDFMSLTIERNINAVSIASIYLANNGFKYTRASLDFTATSVEPPVINTMDQIIIFLKKESYYQYFTGFVTYAPIVTLIPEPIVINASCTLYKAQNSFWDAGAIEYEGIIPGILQNAQIFGGNVQSNDGGVATGMTNLLTKVANWNSNDIHIGGIPPLWVDFATNIYKQTQIQLKDKNVTSFKDIINYLEVTGNNSKSVTYTTTQGKTGVSGETISSLGVNGAESGTALEGITSGVAITVAFATAAQMNTYSLNRTKFGKEADIIVNNVNDTQYWIAAPFTYFSNNIAIGDQTSVKEWLRGAKGPQKYPAPAQVGRLLILTNIITGQQVKVHVAYAIKNSLHLNGSKAILSEAAFIALGGTTTPNSNVLDNISVDGWVDGNSTNLVAGPVAKTVRASQLSHGSALKQASAQELIHTGQPSQWEYNTLNSELKNSDLNSSASPSARVKNSIYEQWEYDFLRGLGSKDPNNLPASLEALARMAHLENGAWHYNWLNVSSPPQYPLTGVIGVLSNNPDHIAIFPDEPTGVAGTLEFFRNSTYLSAFTRELLNPKATLASIAESIPTNVWGPSDVNAVLYGSSAAPINSSPVPGLNNNTGDFNFNTTQGVVGFDTNSTILAGSPRAFITDVPVISTLSTLATMGLREFQSGPDGSFLSWYPDYFGLYGTAPTLSIYDIEIIDFSIYHDDTQLYTHIGVSGDPTSIGDVSLVDWLMTNGIITIENNAILGLLFGSDPATISTNMSSLIAQGIDVNTFAKQFLKRYGMRPYVDSEPMIRSELMEFMYAIQEFMYLWSQQYATNVTFTFMPELYPGMIVELADHGIQVYVQSVSQSCSRDGGFTTSAVITSPTRIIGKKQIRENGKTKVINNVVPLDFGYPIAQL